MKTCTIPGLPGFPRVVAACLCLGSFALHAQADTIYFDDFNDQQNIFSGGPYTQTLAGSVPSVRSGTLGGSASATWTGNAESGGWGQRDYGNNNVATPTSSNYLAFTPQAGYIYTLEADITVNTSLGAEWFAIGFTASPGNWPVTGALTVADYDSVTQQGIVRFQAPNVGVTRHVKYVLDTSAPGWTNTQGIGYVGWFTGWAGNFNLNSVNQVSIDNFKLTSGVANPTVTYDGNGSDGGEVPTDGSSPYTYGATATTLGAGTMTRSGYTFLTWNTAVDGNGTDYSPGSTFTIQNNITLYAKWLAAGTYALTYSGNGSTSGSAPVDANSPYTGGSNVTVLGNTGSLAKTSHSFAGWNTAANGLGTNYNPGDTITINEITTLYARWTPGPDYVWNNQVATDGWNTSDANWSGVAWSDSATNNAFFTGVGGNVFLDPDIVAGAVNVGNTGINFANLNLLEGGLTAASLTVQGLGMNDGNYGTNPTLNIDSAVTIIGDAAVGRANLNISGGTFTADRIISAPASADWGRLVVSGGTVIATNGVDGSAHTGATFAIDLNGGELRTPSIKVADRELGITNSAWLTFNGGTLMATGADNANWIQLYGGGGNTFVAAGGAVIDTNGLNIGILARLLNAGGGGGLVKNGNGTLTLDAANTYEGDTIVHAGALSISSSGSLRFRPTDNTVTNNVSGTGTATLSFLGTISLDLGAAVASGGNTWNLFNLASFTAPVLTPAAVTSTLGVFTETPVDSGIWEFPVTGAKWVFTESTGNLAYVVTATPYESWGAPYGLAAGSEGGDLDNDGLTNFEEFAFGLNPDLGTSLNPITVPLDQASGTFTYQRRKTSLTGLGYTVRTSTTLATNEWTDLVLNTDYTEFVAPSGDNETVTVTLTPAPTSSKFFLQIRAD